MGFKSIIKSFKTNKKTSINPNEPTEQGKECLKKMSDNKKFKEEYKKLHGTSPPSESIKQLVDEPVMKKDTKLEQLQIDCEIEELLSQYIAITVYHPSNSSNRLTEKQIKIAQCIADLEVLLTDSILELSPRVITGDTAVVSGEDF